MDSTNGKVCQSEVPKKERERGRGEREVEGGEEREGGGEWWREFFE